MLYINILSKTKMNKLSILQVFHSYKEILFVRVLIYNKHVILHSSQHHKTFWNNRKTNYKESKQTQKQHVFLKKYP